MVCRGGALFAIGEADRAPSDGNPFSNTAVERRGNSAHGFDSGLDLSHGCTNIRTQHGGSQGQNLAVAVLFLTNSLDIPRCAVGGAPFAIGEADRAPRDGHPSPNTAVELYLYM